MRQIILTVTYALTIDAQDPRSNEEIEDAANEDLSEPDFSLEDWTLESAEVSHIRDWR